MRGFVIMMLTMLSLTASAQEEETCFCGKCVEYSSTEFVSGKDVFDMAVEYQKQGLHFEMLFALWQAAGMGEEEYVSNYVMNNKDCQKIIEITILLDGKTNMSNEQLANYLETCGISNDKEMCIFAEVIRHSDMDKNVDPKEAGALFESIKQKFPDNQFALYVEANFVYDDNEEKQAHLYQTMADNGYVLAYSGLAGCYLAGIGVEGNHQKAAEYYQKAFNAGVLVKHGVTRYRMLLDQHPECKIPNAVHEQLGSLREVSFVDWIRDMSQLVIKD